MGADELIDRHGNCILNLDKDDINAPVNYIQCISPQTSFSLELLFNQINDVSPEILATPDM